jgi:hypothetical protein
MGLVLEWVYGTIVSTAEKARDGAKRQLGMRPPTAQAAFDALLRCLEEQHTWEQRSKASKDLLNRMLQSRKEADDLSKQYSQQAHPASSSSGASSTAAATTDGAADSVAGDTSTGSASQLPDMVILKMLKREALLTSAKLHALTSDLWDCQRTILRLRSSIRHVSVQQLNGIKRCQGWMFTLLCGLGG